MPSKAKLTTRQESTSQVSSDNFAKGSELTYAEADSNFLNLRDQSFAISDGSTSTDIEAGETITFSGATVSGNTVSITGGGGGSVGDLAITGSTISSPSNADLTLTTSGDGNIVVDQTFEVRAYNNGGIWSGTDTILFTGNAASPAGEKIIQCEQPSVGDASLRLAPTSGGYVKIQQGTSTTSDTWIRGGEIQLRKAGENIISFRSNGSDYSQTIYGPLSGDISADRTIRLPGDPGPGHSGTQNLISDTATQTLYNKTLSGATFTGSTTLGDITFDGNKLGTSSSNADLELTASGTGTIRVVNDTITMGDGSGNCLLTTNTDNVLHIGVNQTQADVSAPEAATEAHLRFLTNGNIVMRPAGDDYIYAQCDRFILGKTTAPNYNADSLITSAGNGDLTLTSNGYINAWEPRIVLFAPGSGTTNAAKSEGVLALEAGDYADLELTTSNDGRIDITTATSTTIGSNGAASALTANPVGYVKIKINGTEYQIPYYNT